MLQYLEKIIQHGDASGNNMMVRFRLPSGVEIIGLPSKNYYGGYWDLGPTWNYLVLADQAFLVDSGRFGQGRRLAEMIEAAGLKPRDLGFVLISHGHEDHDGGLAELVNITNLKIKAHPVYDLLIRRYPGKGPPGPKGDFPAKCWHCMMPEEYFTKNCLDYHRSLQELEVDWVGDGKNEPGPSIHALHLPGHCPDSLALKIGDDALLVGDIILPGITPMP
ncbi:MAG TPA: MBL fold metallo-hydrolase, partial [Desulfobacteraceae bacterium]|nr:MBL fold metallo-hydrolase [Desulfobacteraceae bacterium]